MLKPFHPIRELADAKQRKQRLKKRIKADYYTSVAHFTKKQYYHTHKMSTLAEQVRKDTVFSPKPWEYHSQDELIPCSQPEPSASQPMDIDFDYQSPQEDEDEWEDFLDSGEDEDDGVFIELVSFTPAKKVNPSTKVDASNTPVDRKKESAQESVKRVTRSSSNSNNLFTEPLPQKKRRYHNKEKGDKNYTLNKSEWESHDVIKHPKFTQSKLTKSGWLNRRNVDTPTKTPMPIEPQRFVNYSSRKQGMGDSSVKKQSLSQWWRRFCDAKRANNSLKQDESSQKRNTEKKKLAEPNQSYASGYQKVGPKYPLSKRRGFPDKYKLMIGDPEMQNNGMHAEDTDGYICPLGRNVYVQKIATVHAKEKLVLFFMEKIAGDSVLVQNLRHRMEFDYDALAILRKECDSITHALRNNRVSDFKPKVVFLGRKNFLTVEPKRNTVDFRRYWFPDDHGSHQALQQEQQAQHQHQQPRNTKGDSQRLMTPTTHGLYLQPQQWARLVRFLKHELDQVLPAMRSWVIRCDMINIRGEPGHNKATCSLCNPPGILPVQERYTSSKFNFSIDF